MKKIAIYYDSLVGMGGAQRVVIQLANLLNADIVTSGFDPKINEWMHINGNVIDLGNISIKFFKPIGVLFEAPLRFLINRNRLNYDINIYCGFTSIYAAKKGPVNIWRCFTPNRILYDQRNNKFKKANILVKLILKLHIMLFHSLDQTLVRTRFTKIIAQSINIQNRIKKYYGLYSKVIYEPVETRNFKFNKFGNYYLTVSRLFTEKRIEVIVKAFLKMPNKRLIIVGDGPEKEKIIKLSKQAKNITLLTKVGDSELQQLYANCFATIYIPQDEDYGLVPLESMASGKLCIASNEGGCKETIINGKTGFLITPDADSLIRVVTSLNIKIVKKMKNACIEHARLFNIDEWFEKWKNELNIYKI